MAAHVQRLVILLAEHIVQQRFFAYHADERCQGRENGEPLEELAQQRCFDLHDELVVDGEDVVRDGEAEVQFLSHLRGGRDSAQVEVDWVELKPGGERVSRLERG